MFQYPLMVAGSISAHHPNEDILDILHPVSKRAVKTRLEWLTGKQEGKTQAKMPEAAESYSPIDEARELLYGKIEAKAPNSAKNQEKNAKYAPKIGEIEVTGENNAQTPNAAPLAAKQKAKAPEIGYSKPALFSEKTFSHSKAIPAPISQPQTRSQSNPIVLENEFTALPIPREAKKFAIPAFAFIPAKESYAPLPFPSQHQVPIESKSGELEILSRSSLKSQSPNLAIQYLENLREFVLGLADGSRPAREKLASLLSDAADSIKSGQGISGGLYREISAQFTLLATEVKQSLWKAETYIATARFEPLAEKNAKALPQQANAKKTIAPMQASARKRNSNPGANSDTQDGDSLDELTSSPLMSARYAGGRANRCIVSKSSTSVSSHHSFSRSSHRHCPIDGFIGAGGISTHVMHFRSSMKVFYNGLNWIGGWYLVERQCKMGRCL